MNALTFMEVDELSDEQIAKRLEAAVGNMKLALTEAEELLKALSEGQRDRIVSALLEK